MDTGVFIVCYTNSAVNDLRKAGIPNVFKLVPEKVNAVAHWIDSGLKEIIVVKRENEVDLLQEVNKRKLHLVINYNSDRFPEERIEELTWEIEHRKKNYQKNMMKRQKQNKVWEDDDEITVPDPAQNKTNLNKTSESDQESKN